MRTRGLRDMVVLSGAAVWPGLTRRAPPCEIGQEGCPGVAAKLCLLFVSPAAITTRRPRWAFPPALLPAGSRKQLETGCCGQGRLLPISNERGSFGEGIGRFPLGFPQNYRVRFIFPTRFVCSPWKHPRRRRSWPGLDPTVATFQAC